MQCRLMQKNNFSVVKELVGHGIGKSLHEEPQIPNYGSRILVQRLKSVCVWLLNLC